MEDTSYAEKGQHGVGHSQITRQDLLAKEVYGVAVVDTETSSGEIVQIDKETGQIYHASKLTTWGTKIRAFCNKIGAEEGGMSPATVATEPPHRFLTKAIVQASKGSPPKSGRTNQLMTCSQSS